MGDRALRSVMLTRLTQLHMNVVYCTETLTLNSVQRLWQRGSSRSLYCTRHTVVKVGVSLYTHLRGSAFAFS